MEAEGAEKPAQWKPTASLTALKQAASLRGAVHQWMSDQDILEVCTPALSVSATTDPHVESLVVKSMGSSDSERYLHTSPEFAMKRILCAYPKQDIYQIASVFRAEEQGRYHVSQFTMLEWYRTGMNHMALMRDAEDLLRHLWMAFELEFPGVDTLSYSQAVFNKLGLWPDELEAGVIKDYFDGHVRSFPTGLESDSSASLDLFIDEFVLPEFDKERVTFLFEYPSSQAALARIGKGSAGRPVAERFEIYVGQIELANGFHELADVSLQRQRFENDIQTRKTHGQHSVPIDENLLDALAIGLPDCAGIAIGLDRLQMVLGNHAHIQDVLSFSDENA